MALVPRNVFPAKVSGSSKEHSLRNGKENELPSTATVKKTEKVALRRRVSLSSNDDRRTVLAGSIGHQGHHAIAETFSSRKTPFDVHCDDKNVPQPKPQPQARPRRSSVATSRPATSSRDQGNEQKQLLQPAAGCERTDGLTGKPLPNGRSRRNENLLPSKIPRRTRSISTESGRRKPPGSRDDVGNAVSRSTSMAPSTSKAVEKTMAAGRAIPQADRIYRQEQREVVAPATVRINGFARNIVDSIELRARSSRRGRDVSPPTPDSVRTPRTFVVRRQTPKQPARVRASKARPILCASQLIHEADYHAVLSIVEREKEERAPRLSANFLGRHVNAEQRTVIVTFLLHLGTHCRYPSYVIYRAVKLFDAAIDRLPVHTTLIQLTALASLWIALKTLENFHKIPTATTMIRLAKDLYTGREDLLIDYERKILRILDFNITFADAYSLLAYHLINCKRCANLTDGTFAFVYQTGGYAIDVTLLDEKFCRTSASLVAVTAVELALGIVVDTEQARDTDRPAEIRPRWLYWRGLLYAAAIAVCPRFGDRFQDEEIDRCRVAMLRSIVNSGGKNTCLQVVRKKYSRSKFGRIADSLLERAAMLSPLETFDA